MKTTTKNKPKKGAELVEPASAKRTKNPKTAVVKLVGCGYSISVPDGEISVARGWHDKGPIIALKMKHNKTGNVHSLGISLPAAYGLVGLLVRVLPMTEQPVERFFNAELSDGRGGHSLKFDGMKKKPVRKAKRTKRGQ